MEHEAKETTCCGQRAVANENEKYKTTRSVAEAVHQQDRKGRNLPIQSATHARSVAQKVERENKTGMPDNLKAGLESMSGIDMSDIRVHRNSSKPADVGALAYTQGSDIYLGSGQDSHLPHEGWHAVQQKQGRVQPTTQAAGLPVNDDADLEEEATDMGQLASG